MKTWKVTNQKAINSIGIIELSNNEYFHVLETKTRLVFGGMCNVGFIESGYMTKDNCFSLDENLQELAEELEVYYRDGKEYTNRIVCNQRM